MGVQIFASPRTAGDPEFRYIFAGKPHDMLSNDIIEQQLEQANLTRAEFEEGLSDLAASFAESEEWRQLVKENFE